LKPLSSASRKRGRLSQAEQEASVYAALAEVRCHRFQPEIVGIFAYGVTDPGALTIQVIFADAAALAEARQSGVCETLEQLILQELRAAGHPAKRIRAAHVGFAAQTEVDAAGGEWYYFH
jgi:hypothetical protein